MSNFRKGQQIQRILREWSQLWFATISIQLRGIVIYSLFWYILSFAFHLFFQIIQDFLISCMLE